MLTSITRPAGDPSRSADPHGIARAREAAGWSREELADVLGVLPVEVAVWETDALALPPYEREHFRWRIQDAHYERQLAERSGCDWLRQHRLRLDEFTRRDERTAGWAARRIATHRAECEPCRAAIRELGPAPVEPVPPGRVGWMARLPPRLQLPANAVVSGLAAVVGCGLFDVLSPEAIWPWPFPQGPLWAGLLTAWLVVSHRLLRPLGDRDPYMAGQLQAALVIVPAILMLDGTEPLLWALGAVFGVLIGALMGAQYDPDSAPIL